MFFCPTFDCTQTPSHRGKIHDRWLPLYSGSEGLCQASGQSNSIRDEKLGSGKGSGLRRTP
eukprot:9483836-Pyramimonas_sp.AAC.1